MPKAKPAEPAPAPVKPVVSATATIPPEEDRGPEAESAPRQVRRWAFGAGVGVWFCYTADCSDFGTSVGAGLGGAIDVGLRLGSMFELALSSSLVTHGVSAAAGNSGLEGSATSSSVALGARIYPYRLGIVDPYAAVFIGVHDYTETFTDEDALFDQNRRREIVRPLARLQLGADLDVSDAFAISPYLSFEPQFGGAQCTTEGNSKRVCRNAERPSFERTRAFLDPKGTPDASDLPQFISMGVLARLRL